MAKYTRGNYAYAICDRCGDKIKYKELIKEWTGLKVCKPCLDPKTELEFPTRTGTVSDPESLKDARPDSDQEAGNGTVLSQDNEHGQTPVGQTIATPSGISVEIGQVTVSIT